PLTCTLSGTWAPPGTVSGTSIESAIGGSNWTPPLVLPFNAAVTVTAAAVATPRSGVSVNVADEAPCSTRTVARTDAKPAGEVESRMLKAAGAGSLNVTVPVAVASPGTSLLGVIASEPTVGAGITSMALQRVTLLVAQTVTGAEALTLPVVNENVPLSC